jgi:hypothetical protein
MDPLKKMILSPIARFLSFWDRSKSGISYSETKATMFWSLLVFFVINFYDQQNNFTIGTTKKNAQYLDKRCSEVNKI